jgi:hypothetical protein
LFHGAFAQAFVIAEEIGCIFHIRRIEVVCHKQEFSRCELSMARATAAGSSRKQYLLFLRYRTKLRPPVFELSFVRARFELQEKEKES